MTTYNAAVWNGTHQNAEPTTQQAFALTASFDQPYTLAQGIEALIELSSEQGREAIVSVGARYGATQRHNAKCWRTSNALLMEWRSFQAEELTDKLERMGLHHIIFNSTTAAGDNAVAVVLPLANEVDDKSDYSRLASLIASDIGLSGMSDGFHSCTFLVRAKPDAVIYECEGRLIDPEEELPRTDFVSAKDFVGVAA